MNGQPRNGTATATSNQTEYKLYSRRYFDLSPTWFAWNKLTIADVQALRDEPGFEGQKIAFHLNHPIQFVCVVGLVLDILLTGGGRHTLITLEDGSGACIQAKATSRVGGDHVAGYFPSNTLVDSVDVHVQLGVPSVYVRGARIDIGTVLKVKARLDTWFDERQLQPERVWIVKDTNAEVEEWAEIAAWKRRHLAQPWTLTLGDMAQFDERKAQEAEQSRRQHIKQAEKAKRHADKKELKRQSEEKKLNEGALSGSHLLPSPWS